MGVIKIIDEYDVGAARREIISFCSPLPFTPHQLAQLSVIINELALNLVKHAANGGVLVYHNLPNISGIIIRAEDDGPGIADPQLALTDGHSTTGTLGVGLGAIQRLADGFVMESSTTGTVVEVVKMAGKIMGKKLDVSVSAYSRPYPGYLLNGDGFFVSTQFSRQLVALFDALGHGEGAHQTAVSLKKCLQEYEGMPIDDILKMTHRQLQGSRGAVVFLASFDRLKQELAYTSIGNIEARLIWNNSGHRLVNQAGTLGVSMPLPKIRTAEWGLGAILIVTTDGVSARWDAEDYLQGMREKNPGATCRKIVEEWGRADDDATLLMARDARLWE